MRCSGESLGCRFALSARKIFGKYCVYIESNSAFGDSSVEDLVLVVLVPC